MFFAEIAHQANAYALMVHTARLAMRPVCLLDPPGRHLYLPVTFSGCSVIDYKIVPQPVESALLMQREKGIRVAVVGCAMVDDYIFPFRGGKQRDYGAQRSGFWNDQLLSHFKLLGAAQTVGVDDRGHRHIVHLGYPPDGFSRANYMGHILAGNRGVA
jgi:hypothetical protein